MTAHDWLDAYLLGMPGATTDYKAEWEWQRYQVGGKMFAAICLDESDRPYYITLKLDPMEGDMLRQQYADVLPGYYMNKLHWNSIRTEGAVPDDVVRGLLDRSYELVLSKLSKRVREAL